ncbi:MAG: 1-acyl-sn-glycerol-3-phosphate acyltransferase [Treponema sp.]|nr:1-acyl-sn-glycerol-3-phosphate acyltransferase [Treponema sp.]
MHEPYFPDLGIVYPEQPDAHMVSVPKVRELVVDENYPFLEKTFSFRFMRRLMHLGVFTLMFVAGFFIHGMRVEGRKILRKNRKLLKNGAMTICNHVNRWDYLFVLLAVRYRMMFFPAYKENLKSRDMDFIRLAGGIPVPDEISTMKYFNKAFDEIVQKKIWIHAYPESTRFDYFNYLRPFKKGVFSMAHRYKLPIIPIAICYRKSHFPFTLFNYSKTKKRGVEYPLITAKIGEPVLLDESLGRKEAIQKLRKDTHEAMINLMGIKNNPYPAEGD